GQAQAERRSADDRAVHEGISGDDRVHHASARRMARRKLRFAEDERQVVEYADQEPSAFSSMLGGLIEANVKNREEKQGDFEKLVARVGIFVTDIEDVVTLEFMGGKLVVHNGLVARRSLDVRAGGECVLC